MPVQKKIKYHNSLQIAVWEIDETMEQLQALAGEPISKYLHISSENKRKQKLAAQALAKSLGIEKGLQYRHKYPEIKSGFASVTHTDKYVAIAQESNCKVGIDIEQPRPQLERIKEKFLSTEELASIGDKERLEKLCICWSAKECLFKFYRKGGVIFKTELFIHPFELSNEGQLTGELKKADAQGKIHLQYQKVDNYYLVYTTSDLIYP